jgi:hypothetical protein
MRRGFKAEATRRVLEVRAELGLDPHAVFDPWALADLYGIPVYPLSELGGWGCRPAVIQRFASDRNAAISAALVPDGTSRMIVENDHHPDGRRRANVTHEMAHLILEHEFVATILGPDGCRGGDRAVEEEASWFSGELLIPSSAALAMAKRGLTDQQVARKHDVSVEMARWRMNASGARRIAAYSA